MKTLENQSLIDMIIEDKRLMRQIFIKLASRIAGLLFIWLLAGNWLGLSLAIHIINNH